MAAPPRDTLLSRERATLSVGLCYHFNLGIQGACCFLRGLKVKPKKGIILVHISILALWRVFCRREKIGAWEQTGSETGELELC